jgi:8-oxo-dGTP diphosphatase
MDATGKNKKAIEVVALALQRSTDQKYLITRRGPGQSGAGEWEFPGGKVEPGETQTQALVREIDEELSIELIEKRLLLLGDHIEHYPQKSVHIFLWKMTIDSDPAIILTEHDQFQWICKEQIHVFSLSAGDQAFIALL